MDYFFHLLGQLVVVGLVSLTLNFIFYVTVTTSIFYALKYLSTKGLDKHKIQQRQASRADIRREFLYSLRTVAVLSVFSAATYFGVRANLFTVYPGVEPLGVVYLLASVAGLLIVHDTYFYWTHRMMHHRLFFMRGHRGHHKSITPTVYACYAFDVPEAMVIGAFIPLWLLAVPMQLPGLLIPSALLLVKNAMIHCGVELFPRGPDRSRWLCWFCTTTDHDRHHSTLRYNYAILFNFWDRAMGTDYPKVRDQVRAMPVAGAIENPDRAPGRAPGNNAINQPAPGASSA